MKAFPVLTTERLRLRKLDPKDIPSLINYANNEGVSENILNIKLPYEMEDAVFWMNFSLQGFKNNERCVFAITLKEEDAFIGAIGLHFNGEHETAQLAYWIGNPFWGKGLMSEAVEAVIKFGFTELRLHKIYATRFSGNDASAKILLKNGMVEEGKFKEHYKVNGVFKDLYQYGITLTDYFQAK